MGFAARKQIPGRADINEIFKRENIARTRKLYERLSSAHEYRFGDLTALSCGLDEKSKHAWEKEIDEFYSFETRAEMLRVIVAALFHKNEKGELTPASIEFSWSGDLPGDGPKQCVRTTYDPANAAYLLELFGYPSPMGPVLSGRTGRETEND